MAIHERPRENLLGDATAYARRMLIHSLDLRFQSAVIEELFVGLRADGRWSLYFDESPVIQFDSACQLRRVFISPHKYAACMGKLVQLERDSRGGRIVLSQRELNSTTHVELLASIRGLLRDALQCLSRISSAPESPELVQHCPADDHRLTIEFEEFLRLTVDNLRIASGI